MPKLLQHVAIDAADPEDGEKSASARRLKPIRAHRGEQAYDVEQAAESENSVRGRRGGGKQIAQANGLQPPWRM